VIALNIQNILAGKTLLIAIAVIGIFLYSQNKKVSAQKQ